MPDLWVNFQTRLKVAADSAGLEVLWNRDKNIVRSQVADLLCTSGVMDLAASSSGNTVPLGDITTGQILYCEANVDGFTFNIGGSFEIPLNQVITGQPACSLMMTSFTVITVSSGTDAGRFTYFIAGVD